LILSNPFSQKEFTDFIKGFLPEFSLDIRKVDIGGTGFSEVLRLGESGSLMTSVLIVKSKKTVNSRISLANNSFKILKAHNIYRALIVYINDDDSIWRLSLLTALPSFDPTGRVVMGYSNPRRHSYVLGSDVGIATARKYLSKLGPITDFEDLQFRFSVEAVNNDFYLEIAEHFYDLVGRYGDNKEVLKKPMLELPGTSSRVEDLQNYSVRLLGRIVFLWFLMQKSSQAGHPLLPRDLLAPLNADFRDFFHERVEPIFFEVLNKQIENRDEKYREGLYGKVPYLNGGLFSASDGAAGDFYSEQKRTSKVNIRDEWFIALFKTLDTYNFTIDENLENDVDLSIDPEMLGRVFENLLAEINPVTGQVARKSTGSYYTPRSIVNYMVDESISEYLVTRTLIEEKKIRALITTTKLDDIEHPLSSEERVKVINAISKLRVLDPACGSGAFPMGVLQKLLWVITQVDPDGEDFLESRDLAGTEHWLSTSRLDYLRKRKIIRDVIFGIDIQPVAVEIAKLRCFLTLIVDQEIDDKSPNRGIVPLPNLDFKFVSANTLIPLAAPESLVFGEDPDLDSKLKDIREKYFSITSTTKKSKLRSSYEALVSEEVGLFGESVRTTQLKTYRPFEVDTVSSFFDPQQMFGFEVFDIVIANPPYIDSQGMVNSGQSDTREYVSKHYKYAKGNWDIYVAFFEKGLQLLSSDGVLIYITPDKWVAKPYGDALRVGSINQICSILIAGRKVFKTAKVDSIITKFRKVGTDKLEILEFQFGRIEVKNTVLKSTLRSPFLLDFMFSEHFKFLVKIENNFDRLDSIASCENACATSDAYKLKPLLTDLQEVFDPLVQMRVVNTGTIGKFVDRWGIKKMTYLGDKYLCPVVKKDDFLREFPNSYSQKAVMPKVVLKGLNLLDGCLDVEGQVLPGITTLIVTCIDPTDLIFVSAILNSDFSFFYLKERYPAASYNQGTSFTKEMINSLPIPKSLNAGQKKNITDISKKIIKLMKKDPEDDVSGLLIALNQEIYNLYELEDFEIDLIEGKKKKNSKQ
jgi:hypothetical protein